MATAVVTPPSSCYSTSASDSSVRSPSANLGPTKRTCLERDSDRYRPGALASYRGWSVWYLAFSAILAPCLPPGLDTRFNLPSEEFSPWCPTSRASRLSQRGGDWCSLGRSTPISYNSQTLNRRSDFFLSHKGVIPWHLSPRPKFAVIKCSHRY